MERNEEVRNHVAALGKEHVEIRVVDHSDGS
jgi:hypothetical protein